MNYCRNYTLAGEKVVITEISIPTSFETRFHWTIMRLVERYGGKLQSIGSWENGDTRLEAIFYDESDRKVFKGVFEQYVAEYKPSAEDVTTK